MTKKQATPKKKAPEKMIDEEHIKKNLLVTRLLTILNLPETGCKFWKSCEDNVDIWGIKPIKRVTVEVINENGFTPYNKQIDENLFKVFKIFVLNENDQYHPEYEINLRNKIEVNGIIYIRHHDLVYIYETIKNSK